jgi:hypothetical protein
MSAPKNIQRDGIWTNSLAAKLTWPTETVRSAGNILVNAKTAVHSDVADAAVGEFATITAGYREAIGVYMQEPIGDNAPYRVKASLDIQTTLVDIASHLIIGYAPASITGADDDVNQVYVIPIFNSIDELIMVPNLVSGDTYFGRPLFFGIALDASSALTARATGQISVQRLAVKPPTMQNAVS